MINMVDLCVARLATEKLDILTGLPRNISGTITGDSDMNHNPFYLRNLRPFQRHGRPYTKEEFIKLYESDGLTITDIAEQFGIGRKKVQNDMVYFNVKARKAIPRDQHGPKNGNWKGDVAGYAALHRRLYKHQPSRCDVCGTTDKFKTYDWANLTGKYKDPSDYKRMCRGCHWRYDGTIKNITGR